VPRKIDAGDVLAGLGAVLVLIALFLDWFGGASAWEAFELLDLMLALLALAVVAAVVAVPDLAQRALAPLGALMLLFVVVQLLEPPPAVVEDDLGTGAWMALAGSLLVLAGGLLRIARVSVSIDVGRRDARPRVAAVDRRANDVTAPTAPAVTAEDELGATQAFPPLEDDRPTGA
jgi:hypothetical protein